MKKLNFMQVIKYFILSVAAIPGFVYGQASLNEGIEVARMKFQAKQVIPPSPEAAELGKYGNVPVGLFTGTPNVSIPLAELKGNVITLPVSLSYNSSGFKPEEIAPWTGLGWTLNAGGVITRSVLGDPDMDDNYFVSPSPLDPVPTDEYAKQVYFRDIRNRVKDIQPDIYYYNFMGHSGKFFVYPDEQIMKKEKSYLNIYSLIGSAGEKIYMVIDEQGFKYEFSELEKTMITPIDDEPNAPTMTVRTFTSAWYLSKVTSPYGEEELDFEYYSPVNAQSTTSGSLSNNSLTYSLTDDGSAYWQLQPVSNSSNIFHPPGTSIWKKFLKKATLKKEGACIGYIDFESDLNQRQDLGDADFDGERLLKNVKVYSIDNGLNQLVKQFTLGYEYFGANQPETPGNYRRLKLKTIQELSSDTLAVPSKPPYIFYYHGESYDMPTRFTSGLDHWGFYNGQSNMLGSFPTLIPTVDVPAPYIGGLRGGGANREPNAENATMTVLEKISYPTGGYTSFEYEGNSGSPWGDISSDTPVGGIRLKKMTDYSFTDKPAVVKQYEYKNEDGSSSGYTALTPYYYEVSTFTDNSGCPVSEPIDGELVSTGHFFTRYSVTISAGSIFGLGSIQGSHIGYQRVTEKQTDLSTNQPLGKTVYLYNIEGFNETDDQLGNGDLKKKEVYNNGGKLLDEITNTYTYETFNTRITNRKLLSKSQQSSRTVLYENNSSDFLYIDPRSCVINPPEGYAIAYTVPNQYSVTENYIQQQRKKLTEQTHRVYDDATGSYLTTTKKFTYGNPEHNYPTLTEETNSVAEKVYTEVKYVADYTITCSSQTGSMASRLSYMKEKNMMGIPIEKLQYREDANGSNRRYISGEFTQYDSGLPEKIYYLQAKPMPTSIVLSEASCNSTTQLIDPNYRLVATMTYDADMNLKEESKSDDIVTTYFWGYNKLYPVAKVIGKTYEECLLCGINQSVLDNPANDNILRTELNKLRSLQGAMVTSLTYRPGVGVSSTTDARGLTTYYEYDLLNRLVNIKDNEGNITGHDQYNYGVSMAPPVVAQTLFYNAPNQQDFTKAGCPIGTYGDVITCRIPYGKYASAISQADANAKAQAALTANGQAYANATGLCRWYNAAKHVKVFKNDCLPEQGLGSFVWYDVAAGKYKSTVSQADADAMAANDIATLGQVYANANATCSCGAEGQRVINGVCETGTIHHASSVQQSNGQWLCGYFYSFSDGYMTGYYYTYSANPCPVDP